jgi:hypothetical protein
MSVPIMWWLLQGRTSHRMEHHVCPQNGVDTARDSAKRFLKTEKRNPLY